MSFLGRQLLTVCILYGLLHKTTAVACTDGNAHCVKTHFTTATCEGGTCRCDALHEPIETGCGNQLDRPSVNFENHNSQAVLVYEGVKNVALKCNGTVSSMPAANVRISWKFGDKVLEETSITLVVDEIKAETVASPYTCAVAPTSPADAAITSEESEPFKISMLQANTLPSPPWKPVLEVVKYSLPFQQLPLACTNLPIGISSYANIEFFSAAPDSKLSSSTFQFMDVDNATLFCKVTLKADATKAVESDRVIVEHVGNIKGVVISVLGQPPGPQSVTVKTGQPLELRCQDDGTVAFSSIALGYFWTSGTKKLDIPTYMSLVNNRLVVNTTTVGSSTYFCNGQYGTQKLRTSERFVVNVEDEPIVVPSIQVMPVLAKPDSHVSLTCGLGGDQEVSYFWKKNGLFILGQFDRVIQLHQAGLGTDKYSCMAVKDGYIVTSPEVGITVKPNTPILSVSNAPKEFSEGATYILNCTTTPTSPSLWYDFLRGDTEVNGTTQSSLMLANVTSADDGIYTCRVVLEGVVSGISNRVNITIGAAGRYCDSESDCQGKGYRGTCKDRRCECKSHYKKEGDHCASSAVSLTVSILGVIIIVLLNRII